MTIAYQGTSGTRRIRFTSNVSYEGVDYGPDYEQQEVDAAPNEALRFVREGRAQYVEHAGGTPAIPVGACPLPASKATVQREATGLDTKSAGDATEPVNSRAGGGRK